MMSYRWSFTFLITSILTASVSAQVRFQHHFGDRDLGGDAWGQTSLADMDRDGDLDFVTGQRNGDVIWFEFQLAGEWTRHLLGHSSPSDVGGVALDVNQDGWIDFVVGGVWYENTGAPRSEVFRRHIFDPELKNIHDVILADLDDDDRLDVITMSDQNDTRWYRIPDDSRDLWDATRIGDSVHSGISAGDLDGDGDTDIVQSNIWFENLGKGRSWSSHRMTEPWGRTANAARKWERNATQTQISDVDGDGRVDVAITDGEIANARIAWLKAPPDPRNGRWTTHYLSAKDNSGFGALHSLHVADFTGDDRPDIFTVEMESVPGERTPCWFLWENIGAGQFHRHIILDANLGGHEAVVGDVDGDGDLDICSKLWRASRHNSNGGRNHFDYLENVTKPQP